MNKKNTYIKIWMKDFWGIFNHELKQIFSDWGVILIFFVAGLLYPILYNCVYLNGILNDTEIAVVDMSGSADSRRYIRELDATREVKVAYKCPNMAEAQNLLKERKVNGIVYFPEDYGRNLAEGMSATVSVYCDMSSFLYYKNALMAVNHVMLDELDRIQIRRYSAAGMTEQEISQSVAPIRSEENNPYNNAFAYNYFLVSAILLIIIQQTMFYGMSLLVGTQREQNRSFASLPSTLEGHGIGRVVLGRGLAYWLVYLGISIYIAMIVPSLFGLPQRGSFADTMILLLFFLTDCVFFSMAWSTFITRRETVFVLFLFMSPICLFLTGTSWPVSSFPGFWKVFSYLFPTTFGCRAFINMSVAGGDLDCAHSEIIIMTIQTIVYYFIASAAVYGENWIIRHKNLIREAREKLAEKSGIDLEEDARIIGGEASVREYRKKKGYLE